MEKMIKNRMDVELIIRAGILAEQGMESLFVQFVENHSMVVFISEDLQDKYKKEFMFAFMEHELQEVVSSFEEKHEAKVLFGMLDRCFDDTLLTLVFVSKYEHEWEIERADLKNKCPIAMCFTLEDGRREGGYIRYEIIDGKPVRTEEGDYLKIKGKYDDIFKMCVKKRKGFMCLFFG